LSWIHSSTAPKKSFFTARDSGGQLVGFLAAQSDTGHAKVGTWKMFYGYRARRPAPADLLVVETLNILNRSGAKVATLGTAPLARERRSTA